MFMLPPSDNALLQKSWSRAENIRVARYRQYGARSLLGVAPTWPRYRQQK
jgi:hypothetical protein